MIKLEKIFALMLRISYAGVAFLLSVVLARELGIDSYGAYSWVMAILLLLSIPVSAGVPELVVRETSKLNFSENYIDMRRLWNWVVTRVLIWSVLVALSVYLFFGAFPSKSVLLRSELLKIGVLSTPVVALCVVLSAIIRGRGKVILGMLPESLIRPIMGLVLVLIFVYAEQTLGAIEAMYLYLVASLLTAVFIIAVATWLGIFSIPSSNREENYFSETELWSSMLPLMVIGGLFIVNNFLDLILIGVYHDDQTVAEYKVASQFAILVSFSLQAINQILQPRIAALYKANSIGELQQVVRNGAMFISVFSLPIALILIPFGEIILFQTFGVQYEDAYPTMILLVLGQLINALFGSVGTLLNMAGYERLTLRGLGFSVFINFFLGLILIPGFGAEGAAFATMVSLFTWNAILRHYVMSRIKIEPTILSALIRKR